MEISILPFFGIFSDCSDGFVSKMYVFCFSYFTTIYKIRTNAWLLVNQTIKHQSLLTNGWLLISQIIRHQFRLTNGWLLSSQIIRHQSRLTNGWLLSSQRIRDQSLRTYGRLLICQPIRHRSLRNMACCWSVNPSDTSPYVIWLVADQSTHQTPVLA